MEQESLHGLSKKESTKPSHFQKAKHYTNIVNTSGNFNGTTKGKIHGNHNGGPCYICKGPHFVFFCLKDKPANEVERIIKQRNLCYNCLSSTHSVTKCTSKRSCKKCTRRHHTLIHDIAQSNRNHGNQMTVEDKSNKAVSGPVDSKVKIESNKINVCSTQYMAIK